MAPLKSAPLAWGIAIAALALWATSVPTTLGHASVGAAGLFNDAAARLDINDTENGQPDQPAPACPPNILTLPPPASDMTPPPPLTPAQPATVDGQEGTFHLCGGADTSAAARAIEQLIAGRGFSASLSSRGDGCADLTIRVNSSSTGGSASSRLKVSLGSGQSLDIEILSERGATRVAITQGS